MSNMYGRKVVAYKVNKSGGGVIAGDVLVPDTSNDNAFTTTTSAAVTTGVWIADETIASNATGRVVLSGHVTLVNTSASVTRGHTGTTHTVAKQAVSTGGTTRTAGTFCKFTTGGTTPEADIWPVDLGAGSGLTDPMTTRGDMIYRNASNVTDRLAIPAAGQVLGRSGSDLGAIYPPGYELDFAEITSSVTVTATGSTDGATDLVVSGNSVTYDGAPVELKFHCEDAQADATVSRFMQMWLFDGTSQIGYWIIVSGTSDGSDRRPVTCFRRFTPSAGAHTYKIKASVSAGTGNLRVGAGGSGNGMPGFLRITKV